MSKLEMTLSHNLIPTEYLCRRTALAITLKLYKDSYINASTLLSLNITCIL